jgi:AMMECR1 domain-containing protein
LPQVWEQLTDATAFMAQLKRKAGLSPDFWHDDVEIYRYTVTKFKEKDLRQQRSTERLTS